LVRKPFPAQTLAIMRVVKRWNEARAAAVIAECGTGKTLISHYTCPRLESASRLPAS
jgi:superfamily II DNA or RNA helicase